MQHVGMEHERVQAQAAARHRHRAARPQGSDGFGRSLLLTTIGAMLPGLAFIAAGRRRLGAVTLFAAFLVAGGGLWLATAGRRTALHAAVDATALTRIGIALIVLALVWVVIIAAGYRMVRLADANGVQRAVGLLLVGLLCVLVAAPPAAAARYAFVQRDLISTVFDDDTESATRPKKITKANPWAGRERVNLLLLGSDAGTGRTGTRTDSVVVASISTTTGDTTLFSLPRNLENLPFPAGPLREAYPNGFEAPGDEGEQFLNAVYGTVPATHPNILGPTSNPGADVLKLGVGEALGLKLDYYMMINLGGFAALVNALGGITVNINEWIPIGGSETALPNNYLAPGPNQRLNGGISLWYARGRFGSTDYARMKRQRCVIGAIIDSADPVTVLKRYQQLAASAKDIVRTDIPQQLLPAFVDLSMTIKKGTVSSLVFDNHVINSGNPDYDDIRAKVAVAIKPPPPAASPSAGASPATRPTPLPTASPGLAEGIDTSCAYDPVQAQKNKLQGKPPIRRQR